MPKLYKYLGLEILFFSNEHYPINVHAFYGNTQLKVELVIKNGKVVSIRYKKVKGFKPIPTAKKKDLEKLIEKYKNEIIQNWIDFFVYGNKIKVKNLTQKIK